MNKKCRSLFVKHIPLILSAEYSVPSFSSNELYKFEAAAPCMARWKSGLFPFSRLYNVNWLTQRISYCKSLTLFCHRLPASSSNNRIFNSFRALPINIYYENRKKKTADIANAMDWKLLTYNPYHVLCHLGKCRLKHTNHVQCYSQARRSLDMRNCRQFYKIILSDFDK